MSTTSSMPSSNTITATELIPTAGKQKAAGPSLAGPPPWRECGGVYSAPAAFRSRGSSNAIVRSSTPACLAA